MLMRKIRGDGIKIFDIFEGFGALVGEGDLHFYRISGIEGTMGGILVGFVHLEIISLRKIGLDIGLVRCLLSSYGRISGNPSETVVDI
jgi:hypothetical protein